jgi:hypothetical protein
MSAIDFDMTIERQPDPKGDRVKVGMTGKFCRPSTMAPAAMPRRMGIRRSKGTAWGAARFVHLSLLAGGARCGTGYRIATIEFATP